VACWAHARRKFYEARTSDAAISTQALAYIRLLYDVEDAAQEQFGQQRCPAAEPTPSAEAAARDSAAPASAALPAAKAPRTRAAIRYALRQERAVPRLQQFRTWLQSQQAQHGGPVLPRSPLGEAITYTFNQWDALTVYTTDGDLAIDNNVASYYASCA
jgi:transposase